MSAKRQNATQTSTGQKDGVTGGWGTSGHIVLYRPLCMGNLRTYGGSLGSKGTGK